MNYFHLVSFSSGIALGAIFFKKEIKTETKIVESCKPSTVNLTCPKAESDTSSIKSSLAFCYNLLKSSNDSNVSCEEEVNKLENQLNIMTEDSAYWKRQYFDKKCD